MLEISDHGEFGAEYPRVVQSKTEYDIVIKDSSQVELTILINNLQKTLLIEHGNLISFLFNTYFVTKIYTVLSYRIIVFQECAIFYTVELVFFMFSPQIFLE